MKLTVPSLRMSDELIAELAKDRDMTIPDDGLESYDCRFEPVVSEGCAPCAVFFANDS